VLFVSDWQNPPTRFNPFDDDATTLVDSSKSDCPSEDVQSHDGVKQCYHELPNKRKAEPAAEHKQAARSGQLHPITECAYATNLRHLLHVCINKLKALRVKRDTFYTERLVGIGTWYDPDSIGPLEKVPHLDEKNGTMQDSCVVQ